MLSKKVDASNLSRTLVYQLIFKRISNLTVALTVAGELAKLRHNILNMLDQKIAIMMAMILAY